MIDYRQTIRMSLALFSSLLLLALPACSDEEGGGEVLPVEELYKLTISLQSSNNYAPSTKAEETWNWQQEEDEYERAIDDCWIVIYDSDGEWVTTATASNLNGDTQNEAIHATEVGSVTVELPVGQYSCYAFANLGNLAEPTTLINQLETGISKESLEQMTVSFGDNDASAFYLTEDGHGKTIPMSSYETEISVGETENNTVQVVLFRMIGKVEITVSNQTGTDLTVKAISMGNFRKGSIYLLPYKTGDLTLNDLIKDGSIKDVLQPQLPKDVEDGIYTRKVTIPAEGNKISATDSKSVRYMFYAYETGTESNNPSGDIGLTITVNDRSEARRESHFSFMRRNDWLKVPIVISNVQSTMEFETMRMPIGGAPKRIVYGENDGIQFLVDAVNVVDPEYVGPVKVTMTLASISTGSTTISNLQIVDDDETVAAGHVSAATLTDNKAGLLIDAEEGIALNSEAKIKLDTAADGKSCSFSVWTQELSKNSEAIITLNIVATYDGGSIDIPYRIRIQNYEETEESVGGN